MIDPFSAGGTSASASAPAPPYAEGAYNRPSRAERSRYQETESGAGGQAGSALDEEGEEEEEGGSESSDDDDWRNARNRRRTAAMESISQIPEG